VPATVVTIRLRLRLGGGDILFHRLEPGGQRTEIKRQRWQGDWNRASSGVLEIVTEEMRSGCRCFAVDMEPLPWINSDGLGHLILWRKKITDAGGHLAFAAPSDRVRRIFEVSQVDKVLPVHSSIDAALVALAVAEAVD